MITGLPESVGFDDDVPATMPCPGRLRLWPEVLDERVAATWVFPEVVGILPGRLRPVDMEGDVPATGFLTAEPAEVLMGRAGETAATGGLTALVDTLDLLKPSGV